MLPPRGKVRNLPTAKVNNGSRRPEGAKRQEFLHRRSVRRSFSRDAFSGRSKMINHKQHERNSTRNKHLKELLQQERRPTDKSPLTAGGRCLPFEARRVDLCVSRDEQLRNWSLRNFLKGLLGLKSISNCQKYAREDRK
ncbi:hypothetical protein L596_027712 [Steinernema carpocapsae]|uniref:Uncharacterized protein n=1 Tax=Steinernema carpocapsae TaxID=34508 RepID=A0A4U5LWB2_STECR|nr:hypothetical protein L596_027712 [Steinernema carpocapsae]